ncbi:MAG: TonB-dependent receptor, partial [Pseudomonadota bacterium]
GVTLTRNDFGDGSSINLRGLGPQFSRVEINGLTAPVNDARGGGFNFEILASELFSNAEVKKSFNAGDIEGGLAGLVSLSTPRAFDREGFNVSASAQGQYAERADDLGPRAALLVSQNWDNVFGITASVAYSDTVYFTSSNGGISARPLSAPATAELRDTASPEQLSSLIPSTINYEINNDERETLGTTLGFQYRPTDTIEITVDSIYSQIEGERRFTRADAPPESNIQGISGDTIANGVIRSATLTDVQNRIATNDNDTDEEFYQLAASLKYEPNDRWSITPFIGYTERELSTDASLLSFARGDLDTGQLLRYPVSYNLNGQFIEFSSPGLNLDDPTLAEEYFLNVFLIRPTTDRDEELSSMLDFSRSFDRGPISRIDFGGRWSRRETSREFIEVRVDNAESDTDLRTLPTLADALVFEDFDIDGAPASFPDRVISADPDAILDLYFIDGFNIDEYRSPVSGPLENQRIEGLTVPGSVLINRQARAAQNTFSGEEETLALYGEITFEFDDFLFNAGVRYIDTEQTSTGFQVANDFSTPIEVSNSYSELLPSMSMRYEVRPDVIIRSAYSKSLTRPTLNDLRVAESFGGIDESGGSGSRGNPELDPFTSDNFDIGAEWYFADEGLVALNFFYKNIDGLIVSSTSTEDREFLSQVTGELVTGPIIFTQPTNGGPAEVTGVEFIVQSRFDFLPGAFSNFGGIFNYTYAHSDAAFEEGDDSSDVAAIPGLSEDSFNAILYYDDGKLDGRLAYAYRGDFVQSLASSFGVPSFQNARGQLDFSANYSLTDTFTLQFQALNLTEEPLEIESVRGVPFDTGQLDRRLFFGFRYVF